MSSSATDVNGCKDLDLIIAVLKEYICTHPFVKMKKEDFVNITHLEY